MKLRFYVLQGVAMCVLVMSASENVSLDSCRAMALRNNKQMLIDATQINFSNALRGTSNVMPMLWIALFCYVIAGMPATYLLAITASLGIFGIILSFSIPLFLAGTLFLYFFMKTTSIPQYSPTKALQ